MRTDESQAALLRIAYGEIGDWRAPQAAGKWSRNLTNRPDARALLAAQNLDVQKEGFRELCGQPLDEALFGRAAMALTNGSVGLRWNIARLLQMDTNAALAERKAALIVDSMKSTMTCRDAKHLTNIGVETFFQDDKVHSGELILWQQAHLLGITKGVTPHKIREALGSETGIVADFAAVALATTGDATTRVELYRVLTNSHSLTARFAALSCLSWKPQSEDVPALKWVAANDSFQSKPVDPFYFRMAGADQSLRGKKDAKIYPLRFMADQALKRIETNQRRSK